MNIRKSLAGIAAAGLVVSGVAVASAPAANAANFSGTGVSACHLYFGSGLPGTPAGDGSLAVSNSTFAITGLSVSNATPNAGDTVTVTLTSSGFTTGPVGVAVGGLGLTGQVALSGAQTGTVTLTSATPYPAVATGANSSMGAFTLTGTFVASGSGAFAASYKAIEAFDNTLSGANNYCDGAAAGTTLLNPAALATNGASQQTTNFVLGSAGFKVTRVVAGVYTWDVPSSWDPKFASAASSTIQATGTTTGPNAAITAIAGQNVLTAARSTNVITVSGGAWTPSGAITAVTVGGAAATNTLAVDGAGALSGTITVPAGATTGNTTIAISQGANSSSTPIVILGSGAITISPANGGPGTTVTVSGSSFNPSSPHYVFAYKPKPGLAFTPCGGVVIGPFAPLDSNCPATAGTTNLVTSSATGTFSTTVVAGTGMVGVLVAEAAPASTYPVGIVGSQTNGRSAIAAFSLSADQCSAPTADGNTGTNVTSGADYCTTAQSLAATVNPGTLTQQAFDGDGAGPNTSTLINLGAATTTSISAQTQTGAINPITVTDTRGGAAVWALTASLNSITSGSNSIANSNLALGAAGCAPQAGSATGITTGLGGTFASTLTVCDASSNAADSAGGTKGGQWIATAPLTLTVPAFQAAGSYTGTITFTLT